MLVNEILNPMRTPLRASDTVRVAVDAMVSQLHTQMAVIDFTTGKLLGEVNLVDLQAPEADKSALMAFVSKSPYLLRFDTHILDAAGQMVRDNQDVAYVIDDENSYLGTIDQSDFADPISRLLNVSEEGSVVMVQVNERDYALSDIVRIIELEGVRILGIGVELIESEPRAYRISLKLNQTDITKVIHVLNRYGYIITSETITENTDDELHDRADELMRYLSI